jgi:hypothetical protein
MLSSQNPYSPERIDALTKTLATMDARARQKYAAQHKDDPAVIAVALNVNNILAAAERNKAMQAGAQQQSKIVDKEIAGMAPPPQQARRLPEEQGIAQLQAPNLEGMADGGIAGYADGGMTEGSEFDYAQRSEPVVRMAGGGEVPRYNQQGLVRYGGAYGGKNLLPATSGYEGMGIGEFFTQAGSDMYNALMPTIAPGSQEENVEERNRKRKQKLLEEEQKKRMEKYKGRRSGKESDFAAEEALADLRAAAKEIDKTASNVPPGAGAPGAGAPGAEPKPQGGLPTGGPSIKDAQDLSNKFYNFKAIEGKLEQNQAQERQDIFNEKEAREAKQAALKKAQGPAMAGYEKLLKSEELQDTTDKEKAGLTALFKGFLGMAAGESPNAAVNIAKGAMSGLEEYSGAMKEFKKSARERNKGFAAIEEARRAEDRGDLKDTQMYEDKANDYLRASKRHGIDAIMSVTGKSAELSAGIYNNMVNNASANARAMMQINAPSGIEKVVDRMARDPKFAAAYRDYASIGPEARGDQSLLAKYAGPQGLIALQMLEAQGPEGKLQADLIRQKLQNAFLTPTSKPTGPVRD